MNKDELTDGKKEAPFFDRMLDSVESRRDFLRGLGWIGVGVFVIGNVIATARFFYPRVLFEPLSRFKVGKPAEYSTESVSSQYKSKYRVWIARNKDGQIFCLHAKCTHLGCTPNWSAVQNKFKCPCHGSGFYLSGENFEGPAPRPLDRFKISLSEGGELVVDKSIVFKGVAGMDSDEVYPQSLLSV